MYISFVFFVIFHHINSINHINLSISLSEHYDKNSVCLQFSANEESRLIIQNLQTLKHHITDSTTEYFFPLSSNTFILVLIQVFSNCTLYFACLFYLSFVFNFQKQKQLEVFYPFIDLLFVFYLLFSSDTFFCCLFICIFFSQAIAITFFSDCLLTYYLLICLLFLPFFVACLSIIIYLQFILIDLVFHQHVSYKSISLMFVFIHLLSNSMFCCLFICWLFIIYSDLLTSPISNFLLPDYLFITYSDSFIFTEACFHITYLSVYLLLVTLFCLFL